MSEMTLGRALASLRRDIKSMGRLQAYVRNELDAGRETNDAGRDLGPMRARTRRRLERELSIITRGIGAFRMIESAARRSVSKPRRRSGETCALCGAEVAV